MGITTDPNDHRLGHGVDTEKVAQHEAYLALPDEELEKGFVRPVRYSYIHIGTSAKPGCKSKTSMNEKLAETYAREPYFYGATYCVKCQMHLPVEEFTWEDGEVVGS